MSINETEQAQRPLTTAQEEPEQVDQRPLGRRRVSTPVVSSVVAALVLSGLGYGFFAVRQAVSTPAPYGGVPPWVAPADPQPGIRAAGLKTGPMGTAEHYHAHLDVFVDGAPVTVAANIGIDPESEEMTALHTHDTRGVLHIEPAEMGHIYTLGQIFKQWGVTLTAGQIGALRTGNGKTLTAYVNGQKVAGDPAVIVLKSHAQVALVYGAPDPSFTPPASYQFKSDE
ncbi:hypothetical protein GCM10022226_05670 [Sphaerisporangium flaviroseum]|uniref:DUF4115 domain-containing protein n=1 Tax=Sphaerisporangium flaviroseum TaxID=509199 RepID=A0ABP7HIE4_9ACTN